jgi:hypothetical protein
MPATTGFVHAAICHGIDLDQLCAGDDPGRLTRTGRNRFFQKTSLFLV